MGGVSFKKSYGGGKSNGGDVSDVTSSASPRQWLGLALWTFMTVDSVSPKTGLAEMGRFKATQRSLSLFKWGLIARVSLSTPSALNRSKDAGGRLNLVWVSILLRQQHRGGRSIPLGNDPDLGATIRQVGGQQAVPIGEGAIVGGPVLGANVSPIPSLVAMEPPQEQIWWHELEGGWGGDDLAEWEWRIHRHFYHLAMTQ